MSKDELVATLRDMADAVEHDDSFGGRMAYDLGLEYDLPPEAYAMVTAVYRIGNSIGQGGVRMVGEVVAGEDT
jgi:hypothetical protein